jgi:hypothetical protein
MKNLILLVVLLIPFSMFAQNKLESKGALVNDQTDIWMSKISSDPGLRAKMLDMIIVNTKGNEEEMQELVNSLLFDADMNKMITKTNTKRANNEMVFVEKRGFVPDSIEVGKMHKTIPIPKK